ncbi:unnamed protein product, partial [Polarella glacialis]
APKKRKAPACRARAQKVIERDVLTESVPDFARCRGDGEVCGACLLQVEADAQVGLVDNCRHVFHYECVDRWSQTENTCPQCKLRFFWLAAYCPGGQRKSLRKVERKDQEGQEDDGFEDISICEKCKEVGDEGELLLCDGMHGTCNATFHFACVGLTCVPHRSWFCPDCVDRGFDTDARGVRGKARITPSPTQEESTPLPRTSSASSGSGSFAAEPPSAPQGPAFATAIGGAVAEKQAVAGSSDAEPCVARLRSELQAAAVSNMTRGRPSDRGRGRGRSQGLPSQLRLSALACVTPAVEVPTFQATAAQAGGEGGAREGLFASFVQRRRARTAAQGDSSSSFIKLSPTYEDDFMGGQAKS